MRSIIVSKEGRNNSNCHISDCKLNTSVLIFHGTEGYPEENWFPWLKHELEPKDFRVLVPDFPSPPIVPAKIAEWYEVFEEYRPYLSEDSILIGHSLGGIFALRILERLDFSIRAAFFVGTPIGIQPILNFDRDKAFSGFDFDFATIKTKAAHFVVYHSDNDPYVGLANGKRLAAEIDGEFVFVPGAGHFHEPSGYLEFPFLRDKILELDKK